MAIDKLTPVNIVHKLDEYIVSQPEAKRALAIALRNRERRRELPEELRKDITPKNILLIGPTGVGKTELARRLAALVAAPFIKVDATKFTEVGYVGRDVDSIITDLMEVSVMMVYDEKMREVETKAEKLANEKLLDYLCEQMPAAEPRMVVKGQLALFSKEEGGGRRRKTWEHKPLSRQYMAKLLRNRQLEEQLVEIEIAQEGRHDYASYSEGEEGAWDQFADSFHNYSERKLKRRVPVREARRIITREEANRLIDFEAVIEQALERAQERGVVFVDELDKLCAPRVEMGRDVSGEGVQRDLLPILGGTSVMSRFGPVKTDYVLFIAAGSFYQNKPTDLIPELQGRLPLRVELKPLSRADLERILVEPRNALTRQYQALLATEGVELVFSPDGIAEIARLAEEMNQKIENIGARRLYTIMEQVLEELSYHAAEKPGERVAIDAEYVSSHVGHLIKDDDLSRYIL